MCNFSDSTAKNTERRAATEREERTISRSRIGCPRYLDGYLYRRDANSAEKNSGTKKKMSNLHSKKTLAACAQIRPILVQRRSGKKILLAASNFDCSSAGKRRLSGYKSLSAFYMHIPRLQNNAGPVVKVPLKMRVLLVPRGSSSHCKGPSMVV